jgi:hypothetical protein
VRLVRRAARPSEWAVVGNMDGAGFFVIGDLVGRYCGVSERFMSAKDVYETACAAVQMRPPKRGAPLR